MSKPADPFQLLIDLAAYSTTRPAELPAREAVSETWCGVAFKLGDQLMVAPMEEVDELLIVPSWTPLPGVKDWVRGVANVRGRLLPLIDIELFFGESLSAGHQAERVLSVEQGEVYSGLIVGEVYGLQHFPVDAYIDKIPATAAAFAPFCLGAYAVEDSLWTVFSPLKLTRDQRFINAAA